jgi:thiosulfate/3-mercaptopyruvate sulfurtransferase
MMMAQQVDAAWLRQHLQDPDLRVLDCTTFMTPQPVGPSRIDSGRPQWLASRIPGSQHVCMLEDLSDPAGRFPYTLPTEARVRQRLGLRGITPDHQLVLYGNAHPMVVTRAWWVLTTLGWPRVHVLDGGLQAWINAGGELAKGAPEPSTFGEVSAAEPAGTTPPQSSGGWSERVRQRLADAHDVAQAVQAGSAWLVNALSVEQFTGQGGAHYGRPGRIPSSLSLPARDMFDAGSGLWLDPDRIRQRAAEAGLVNDGRPVIVYCGGGIAATATAFALERAGWTGVKVYDNSLLEWSADPDRPMITG